MTQAQRIEAVKNAPNMVEIEGVLSDVAASYLNKYAAEQAKAPADIEGQQNWVLTATMYFIFDITKDAKEVWENIPARFHKSEMYKKLLPHYTA